MADIGQTFRGMDISVSAMQAQRKRMDIVTSNLANAESTRSAGGGPYQRQQVVFESMLGEAVGPRSAEPGPGGVRVSAVIPDTRPPVKLHMPGHPDADANGDVLMPDIRPAEEMADLLSSARSYEANAAAFKITRSIIQKSLELGRA